MLTVIAHDLGWLETVGCGRSFLDDAVTAVLVDTAHTPDVSEELYSDISGDECTDADYSQQLITGKCVAYNVDDEIRACHDKINFAADAPGGTGTIAGRYAYYVYGSPGLLMPSSRILFHIDLTGDGNAQSENGEFSITPNAEGLYTMTKPEPEP